MAERTLHIAGQALTYQLKRSARRSIGLKIGREGLTVTIPTRLSLAEADRVIQQKIDWIRAKLAEMQTQPAGIPLLANGANIFWLGEGRILQTGSGRSRLEGEILHLAVPDNPEKITLVLARYYQRAARPYFAERVQIWGERMGLTPRKLALSSARGRWGSCTASGGIRLNWRLMQTPPEVIDYVVIHELAHLAELNHSPRFWTIVATYCPHWKTQRNWLKLHSAQLMGW